MKKLLMGKYELREQIGEGGSGIVYLAWDRHLERFAAVKEEKKAADFGKGGALKTEMEMLKALNHPMLPAVYDYFYEENQYLVLEYIQGESLHNLIEREGSIPEKQVCEWGIQLLELLSYMHEQKPPVIYRDLKPDNIIVCPDGNLRVIDLGAAFWSRYDGRRQEELAGTIGYAAPEQLREKKEGIDGENFGKADERSDIYTFGATLYHMLTGYDPSKPPYGMRPVRCMNPEVSSGIERIVNKCIETEPSKRYQSAEEIQRDLQRKDYLGRYHFFEKNRNKRQYVIRKMEKKIRLTEKRTTGLLGGVLLIGIMLTVCCPVLARTKEETLPVIVYNTQGQKLVIRYDSIYTPEGNMILELNKELFDKDGIQELSVSLTDRATGERRERIFYIQGDR